MPSPLPYSYASREGLSLCAFLGDTCATLELTPQLRELHTTYYEPLAEVGAVSAVIILSQFKTTGASGGSCTLHATYNEPLRRWPRWEALELMSCTEAWCRTSVGVLSSEQLHATYHQVLARRGPRAVSRTGKDYGKAGESPNGPSLHALLRSLPALEHTSDSN